MRWPDSHERTKKPQLVYDLSRLRPPKEDALSPSEFAFYYENNVSGGIGEDGKATLLFLALKNGKKVLKTRTCTLSDMRGPK